MTDSENSMPVGDGNLVEMGLERFDNEDQVQRLLHDGETGPLLIAQRPKHRLLDHGYLQLVENWGSDQRIVESARMSTQKGFIGWGPLNCAHCINGYADDGYGGSEECMKCDGHGNAPGDEKLLRFLYENAHMTPFEMAGFTIEVKAPIFVFREWHRHRTQSYNEMSGRYVELPNENYVPSVERLMMNAMAANGNKQAGTKKGAKMLTVTAAIAFREDLEKIYLDDELLYQRALDDGVPRELARVHLPVARYSVMRASANLRNWLAFMTLRQASNAQWEIRQYADAAAELVKTKFPRVWELYDMGRA